MHWSFAVITTLIIYQFVLIGVGLWARKQNRDQEDYYLGGRRLGAWVAALSASASSSSAWSLLGVSGAAFAWGYSAVWLIPATLSGFLINWYLIAPRLQAASRGNRAVTLSEFLADGMPEASRRRLMQLAALIILFSFTFYIASQFQAAGKTFAGVLGVDETRAILIGAAVVLLYTFLGGFWAASVTDSLQGALMALAAVLLPVAALVAVGGPAEMVAQMQAVADSGWTDWFRRPIEVLPLGFAIGLLGIGLGYPGQPHVVNRFMALESAGAIPKARAIAIAWAAVIYLGMILLGWCGRLLVGGLDDSEQVLFAAARLLFPAVLAGIVIAAILSAIMSTADSQLLVAASSVSHDMHGGSAGEDATALRRARWVVFIVGALAIAIAVFFDQSIFNRVLFAWHAVGSAFGPLLFVLLWRGPVDVPYRFGAMLAGFALTVIIHWFPNTPGDIAERYLPLLTAFGIAWAGSRPR